MNANLDTGRTGRWGQRNPPSWRQPRCHVVLRYLVIALGALAWCDASAGSGDAMTKAQSVVSAASANAEIEANKHRIKRLKLLSYPSSQALNTSTAVNLTLIVRGTATSYSVTPALPAGLDLDAATGVITGTLTVAAA